MSDNKTNKVSPKRARANKVLEQGVNQILSQYGKIATIAQNPLSHDWDQNAVEQAFDVLQKQLNETKKLFKKEEYVVPIFTIGAGETASDATTEDIFGEEYHHN